MGKLWTTHPVESGTYGTSFLQSERGNVDCHDVDTRGLLLLEKCDFLFFFFPKINHQTVLHVSSIGVRSLECCTFRWLCHLAVLVRGHLVAQSRKDSFNRVIRIPIGQHIEVPRINLPSSWVNTVHCNARNKMNDWWFIRVVRSTVNAHIVYSSFVGSAVRAKNGTHPTAHENVILVAKSVANAPIANSFLTLFKFFKQAKVPWHFYSRHLVVLDPLKTYD